MQDGDKRFSTYDVIILYCGICKSAVTRFSPIQYKNGNLKPLFILWDAKRKYAIEKVLNIKYPSDAAKGQNRLQYTCMINGYKRALYYEHERWFVESRS